MWPDVSVLLPVLDEAATIDACLASLTAQDYPGRLEVVVADGGSRDGTGERLAAWSRSNPAVRVVDNPARLQSDGVNVAARRAGGEILVRADAHTTYAPDYVRRSVEALRSTDAVAVGGLLRPEGTTPFGRAVAAAMRSPLAVGPGRFHHARLRQTVDTVYLGAFRAADFHRLGGPRSLPSGVAEDADLYYRWRRAGETVLLDPAIRSTYRPRESPAALWRQHVRYGRGKAEMLWLNRRLPSWRPLGPAGLVAGLLAGGLAAASGRPRPLRLLVGAWSAVVVAAAAGSARSPAAALRVAAATAIMHLGYGLGLLRGLLAGPGAVAAVARSTVDRHPSDAGEPGPAGDGAGLA
ncbi:MAG TPA: glycosyltransferase family 2 protein [Egibacteraceae bacterium]|nr:glycosyltransferase family 2 protein [Egibacteraceae bacterium]